MSTYPTRQWAQNLADSGVTPMVVGLGGHVFVGVDPAVPGSDKSVRLEGAMGERTERPASVEIGQRWRYGDRDHTVRSLYQGGDCAEFSDHFCALVSDMLTSPDWTFLGGPADAAPPLRPGDRVRRRGVTDPLDGFVQNVDGALVSVRFGGDVIALLASKWERVEAPAWPEWWKPGRRIIGKSDAFRGYRGQVVDADGRFVVECDNGSILGGWGPERALAEWEPDAAPAETVPAWCKAGQRIRRRDADGSAAAGRTAKIARVPADGNNGLAYYDRIAGEPEDGWTRETFTVEHLVRHFEPIAEPRGASEPKPILGMSLTTDGPMPAFDETAEAFRRRVGAPGPHEQTRVENRALCAELLRSPPPEAMVDVEREHLWSSGKAAHPGWAGHVLGTLDHNNNLCSTPAPLAPTLDRWLAKLEAANESPPAVSYGNGWYREPSPWPESTLSDRALAARPDHDAAVERGVRARQRACSHKPERVGKGTAAFLRCVTCGAWRNQ